MAKTAVLAVAAFLVGGVLGYGLWLIVWSPVMGWFSGYPEPWQIKDGALVINDLFGAIGKVVGLLVLPLAVGVSLAKLAVEWYDERWS